jgi:hypothetical protein
LFSEKDVIGNVIPIFLLLSAQVLEKFGIGWNLLDGIKEWKVHFYLLENLHHVLYFLSLFFEVRGCLETFWKEGSRLIWCLKNGSG